MTPEFSPEQRELLQDDAGDLFQQIVLKGSVAATDDRIVAGGPDHESFTLLLDLGLLALEASGEAYLPVDPAIAQSRVVAPMGQRAADLLSESTGWATTFAELGQTFRRTAPSDLPLVEIRGQSNINRFLAASVADAESELLAAHPGGAGPAANLSAALERDRKALTRGVKLRALYQHPSRRSTAAREYVDAVTALGAEVRTLDELFDRLIVVDRRLAIIPGADDAELAVAIHDVNLVSYLVDLFDRAWGRAHPFHDRDAESAIADDVHHMAIRMLVEGHSDHAGSHRMGVSTRTYAGYVASLKAAYNVETRFQLGYAIGQQELREKGRKKGREKPPPQI